MLNFLDWKEEFLDGRGSENLNNWNENEIEIFENWWNLSKPFHLEYDGEKSDEEDVPVDGVNFFNMLT